MKAINIEWDVDNKKDLEFLPEEITIPKDIIVEDLEDYNDEVSDYISDFTGYCHKGFELIKDFSDIKVGDKVVIYDTYSHDYDEHIIEIESAEKDQDFITETTPEGWHFHGKDLSCWDNDEQDYTGDEYITVVDESNYCRHCKDEEVK